MEIGLRNEHCCRAYFVDNMRFCLTISKYYLQEPRTIQQIERKDTIVLEIKEKLSKSTIFQRNHMVGQKGSENQANLLSSKLARRQVLTF